MDSDSFTQAGMRPGNGTGPGTGVPRRRGPRVGPRQIRGAPNHLRIIILNAEGRWANDHSPGLHYCGGLRSYVHFVNPARTDIIDLFDMVQAYLRARGNTFPMNSLWYEAYGEERPGSIHCITRDQHVRRMWANAAANGERAVHLFCQDEAAIFNEDESGRRSIYYLLPGPVPINRHFDAQPFRAAARERHQGRLQMMGAELIGMQELYGYHWYISNDPTPRAAVELGVELRARPGRQMSSIRLDSP